MKLTKQNTPEGFPHEVTAQLQILSNPLLHRQRLSRSVQSGWNLLNTVEKTTTLLVN